MYLPRFVFCIAASIIVLTLANSLALAQATRTWVSGVGDDANPGSRTAPCKTFAGAISKTAAGGEIDCLDPGGFGAVTITKSITLDGAGTFGSILASGTNGIVVNAGANDVVTIRNLSINGNGTGLNGIRFLAGAALHVENCVIFNFSQNGIDFEPTGASELYVEDSIIRGNRNASTGTAVLCMPGVAGSAKAFVDRVILERNEFGLRVNGTTNVTMRNSDIASNTLQGIRVGNATGIANLESCVVVNNASFGVRTAAAGAVIRLSNVTVMSNGTGLSTAGGGTIVSFGNNRIADNVTDGAPTATIPQQ